MAQSLVAKMGVTQLWQVLGPVEEHLPLSSLCGQTLAVDLSIWVCETQCVKQMQGVVSKPFLRNLFFRISHLSQLGVKLVFVIEGSAPELKWDTMMKRQQARFPGRQGKPPGAKPGGTQNRRNFNACLRELVDGCLTNDGDAFLYGAKTVYRNFTMNTKDPHVEMFRTCDIEKRLGITHSGLVALGLLVGCDFVPKGVPGIGVANAVRLLQSLAGRDVIQRMREWRSMSESACLDQVEQMVRRKALDVPDFPQDKSDGSYYVTIENQEMFAKCYPDVVDEFALNIDTKKKVKGKKKKKKGKDKDDNLDNISFNFQKMNLKEVTTKLTESAKCLPQDFDIYNESSLLKKAKQPKHLTLDSVSNKPQNNVTSKSTDSSKSKKACIANEPHGAKPLKKESAQDGYIPLSQRVKMRLQSKSDRSEGGTLNTPMQLNTGSKKDLNSDNAEWSDMSSLIEEVGNLSLQQNKKQGLSISMSSPAVNTKFPMQFSPAVIQALTPKGISLSKEDYSTLLSTLDELDANETGTKTPKATERPEESDEDTACNIYLSDIEKASAQLKKMNASVTLDPIRLVGEQQIVENIETKSKSARKKLRRKEKKRALEDIAQLNNMALNMSQNNVRNPKTKVLTEANVKSANKSAENVHTTQINSRKTSAENVKTTLNNSRKTSAENVKTTLNNSRKTSAENVKTTLNNSRKTSAENVKTAQSNKRASQISVTDNAKKVIDEKGEKLDTPQPINGSQKKKKVKHTEPIPSCAETMQGGNDNTVENDKEACLAGVETDTPVEIDGSVTDENKDLVGNSADIHGQIQVQHANSSSLPKFEDILDTDEDECIQSDGNSDSDDVKLVTGNEMFTHIADNIRKELVEQFVDLETQHIENEKVKDDIENGTAGVIVLESDAEMAGYEINGKICNGGLECNVNGNEKIVEENPLFDENTEKNITTLDNGIGAIDVVTNNHVEVKEKCNGVDEYQNENTSENCLVLNGAKDCDAFKVVDLVKDIEKSAIDTSISNGNVVENGCNDDCHDAYNDYDALEIEDKEESAVFVVNENLAENGANDDEYNENVVEGSVVCITNEYIAENGYKSGELSPNGTKVEGCEDIANDCMDVPSVVNDLDQEVNGGLHGPVKDVMTISTDNIASPACLADRLKMRISKSKVRNVLDSFTNNRFDC
ncbi:GEN-like protein [Mya arenaria]|uniref:GEN-like protein n=1 Tax=Mya arenaria TaxID=6604 RepID=A0ABY7E1U8_MYAAR|nr:GEN-like protein [Mya arenaria]